MNVPDCENSALITNPHWESTLLNHCLYDLAGRPSGGIAEDLGEDKCYYFVYLNKEYGHNKIFSDGYTDTLESAQFLVEMLSIKAGWRFD